MLDVTRLMANRLQRFIPDRNNAEGMAEALQEDLNDNGYWIGGPGGIRVIMGKCLCAVCRGPIEHGDLVAFTQPRWWQFWLFKEMLHADWQHKET